MRGKRRKSLQGSRASGITPADAGKTYTGYSIGSVTKDHPRGCGENEMTGMMQQYKQGSPPRMRGKRRRVARYSSIGRITPADAGKTVNSLPLSG